MVSPPHEGRAETTEEDGTHSGEGVGYVGYSRTYRGDSHDPALARDDLRSGVFLVSHTP